MNRVVEFRKWRNPFSEEDEWVEDFEKEYGEDEEDKLRPVLLTNLGYIPTRPYHQFSKSFNFWMAHTNFTLTKGMKYTLDRIEGIEFLDFFTKHRFRFSVGELFKASDVFVSIQEALDATPPFRGELNPYGIKMDRETRAKARDIISRATDQWAMLILPNGEIDYSSSNTQDGYDMQMTLYKKAQKLAKGIIITGRSNG